MIVKRSNKSILQEVSVELKRFKSKLDLALKQDENTLEFGTPKYFASVKRAALDLKQELTKITQSSHYKWQRNDN